MFCLPKTAWPPTLEVAFKELEVILSGAAPSTDLGGSSNYSKKHFEH